jgi:hypothetical protein
MPPHLHAPAPRVIFKNPQDKAKPAQGGQVRQLVNVLRSCEMPGAQGVEMQHTQAAQGTQLRNDCPGVAGELGQLVKRWPRWVPARCLAPQPKSDPKSARGLLQEDAGPAQSIFALAHAQGGEVFQSWQAALQ